MEISRYHYNVQKAIYNGIRLARSYGHGSIEVEHVALAALQLDPDLAESKPGRDVPTLLGNYLKAQPRVYGTARFVYGRQLLVCFSVAEQSTTGMIHLSDFWRILVQHLRGLGRPSAGEGLEVAGVSDGSSFLNRKLDEVEENFAPHVQELGPESDSSADVGRSFESMSQELEIVEKYCIDLCAQIAGSGEDPVVGREKEVRKIIEILSRKKKNNPLLLGEAGVGKSSIVEGVAAKLLAGEVAENLSGRRVYSLNINWLVSGTKYRGEFEERVTELLKALENLSGMVVVFIDEIHQIIGAGNAEGGVDLANTLKPALARAVFPVIGATTYGEFKKYIEPDPALVRRFQSIFVAEPTIVETISILRGLRSKYEEFHGVTIEDSALVSAVELTGKYLPNRRFPDKAIDLIDGACAQLRLEKGSMPGRLSLLDESIALAERELAAVSELGQSVKQKVAAQLKIGRLLDERKVLNGMWSEYKVLMSRSQNTLRSLEKLENFQEESGVEYSGLTAEQSAIALRMRELEARLPFLSQVVDAGRVAAALSEQSSIPISQLNFDSKLNIPQLEDRLSKGLYGQAPAVQAVARTLKRLQVGLNDPTMPIGVFLFTGPTGVGKTMLAKSMATELFGDASRLIRIDMSEYAESFSVSRLIGAPPGYRGYGEGGELTEAVKRQPFSVLLFDEFEKAHVKIHDTLLHVFDEGRLTDANGDLVDFRNTIIIVTTNILTQYSGIDIDQSGIRNQLVRHFKPELVNRFDEVIFFRSLGREHFVEIIKDELFMLNAKLFDQGIRISIGTSLLDEILHDPSFVQFGGRAVKRAFKRKIVDEVTDKIIETRGSEDLQGHWLLDSAGSQVESIHWNKVTDPTYLLPSGA